MINLNDQGQVFPSANQVQSDNGGPAFPIPLNPGQTYTAHSICDGMTLREYAAIKLRVPDSGTDWLDEMIRKSVRDEFAAKAMQSLLVADGTVDFDFRAKEAYEMADAMLRARVAV